MWHFGGYLSIALISVGVAYLNLIFLRQQQMLDHPNDRSSHEIPTPRGGGLGFSLLFSLFLIWYLLGSDDFRAPLVVLCAGFALSLLGFLDDRLNLSAIGRLWVQLGVVALAVVFIGIPPGFTESNWLYIAVLVAAVAGVIWWVNLFNFLDGIDGYAVSEAIFLCLAAYLLFDDMSDFSVNAFTSLAMCLVGFALFNWSPAKMFMGDTGSYFLGIVLALLMLITVFEGSASILAWLVVTSLFWIDATVTLIRRMISGRRWYQAHRSHAYQILSRRWSSHKKVVFAAIALNLCWLLPLGLLTQNLVDNSHILFAMLATITACAPVLLLVMNLKAGVEEADL